MSEKEEVVCESQTRPTTGGCGKDRKCLAEHIEPCAFGPERSDFTLSPSRQGPQPLGTSGGSGSGPRTWDTSPQAIDTHPADKPRAHNCQQLRQKKIFSAFLALAWPGWPPGTAPDAPRTVAVAAGRSHEGAALIAQ